MTLQQLEIERYYEDNARGFFCLRCDSNWFLNAIQCNYDLHYQHRFAERVCPYCNVKVDTRFNTVVYQKKRLLGAVIKK